MSFLKNASFYLMKPNKTVDVLSFIRYEILYVSIDIIYMCYPINSHNNSSISIHSIQM